jgi:hypothetical protein
MCEQEGGGSWEGYMQGYWRERRGMYAGVEEGVSRDVPYAGVREGVRRDVSRDRGGSGEGCMQWWGRE